jgi:cytochrome c oxidase cbb3-type subunit 3
VSKDTNRLLGHAEEADGIEEYDNPLPDWWVGLFWLTIIWAVGYGLWYHVIGNRSQEAYLAEEMAAAEAMWPEQAEAAAQDASAFTVTAEAVAAGEGVFSRNCVACHGPTLEGGIGPSFVDEEWIHGGQASDILRIIVEGVPAKGMVPWRGILSPEQINQVAAFVISKHSEATGRAVEDIVAGGEQGEPEGPGTEDPVG